MSAVGNFFKAIGRALVGAKKPAQALLDVIFRILPEAFPIIQMVTALTPTSVDDMVMAGINARFPKFFDPTLTPEERKLYLLAVAAEMLKKKYPELNTTAGRTAVQLAYGLAKTGARIETED